MLIRYSAKLNTGEIIVDSVAVNDNLDIMKTIMQNVGTRIQKLRVGQATNNLELARQVDIRYLSYNSRRPLTDKKVIGPYTVCI